MSTLEPAAAYVANDSAAYERFLGRSTGRLAKALIDSAELPPIVGALPLNTPRNTQGERVLPSAVLRGFRS